MDPSLVELVANLGFPIGVAIFLLFAIPKLTAEIQSLQAKIDALIRITEYSAGLRRKEDIDRADITR